MSWGLSWGFSWGGSWGGIFTPTPVEEQFVFNVAAEARTAVVADVARLGLVAAEDRGIDVDAEERNAVVLV